MTEPRVIQARQITLCRVCNSNIAAGSQTAHRPGFGWAHYPKCYGAPTASDSGSGWDDLTEEADDKPEPSKAKAPAKKSEPKALADIRRELFEELARVTSDQMRLARALVGDEMKAAFDAALPSLLLNIGEAVTRSTNELVAAKMKEARAEFQSETKRAIAEIASSGVVRQEITIITPSGERRELAGEVFHEEYEWLLTLAQAGKPIFLPGPTGCGKTHLAAQIARGLHGDKWRDRFGILSCSPATAERHFLGRSIPNITTGQDVYRTAEFVRCYEEGGVFVADEIDAADASVLLVFNAALANGYLPLPDRTEKPIAYRHKDFVFVACANTWGRGADRMYVGRNRLDEATLDRFRIGTVPLDYSRAIEMAVCPDVELYETLVKWREGIYANRLERVISTRFFADAFDMRRAGAPLWRIAKAFFGGWRDDEARKVLGSTLGEYLNQRKA